MFGRLVPKNDGLQPLPLHGHEERKGHRHALTSGNLLVLVAPGAWLTRPYDPRDFFLEKFSKAKSKAGFWRILANRGRRQDVPGSGAVRCRELDVPYRRFPERTLQEPASMATAAQIDANRRNAQRSTGPRTDDGKTRARCNALKHGMAALTIMPALPQEDPQAIEACFQEWDSDMQPQNAAERALVRQGAWLTLALERGERIEMAHLGGLVLQAGRERTQKPSARQLKQVRELGRKLLYITGSDPQYNTLPPWDDDPAVFVRELEESAEGCCWLLERWAQYRNLLDHKSKWEEPELQRFIRLQGKDVIESVYVVALNSIFLAWDVLAQKSAKRPTSPPGPTARPWKPARRSSGTGGPSRPRGESCCGRSIRCAKCGSRNWEVEMRNQERLGRNARWQMTNAGWQMTKGRTASLWQRDAQVCGWSCP